MSGPVYLRSVGRYGLFALLLAVLATFLVWPVVLTVGQGFRTPDGELTLRYFFGQDLGVLRDPLYVRGLLNSLMVAFGTTLLCLVLTLPLATLAARYEFRGKALVTSLVLIPLILPPFVGAIGMRALLGRAGAINTLLGMAGIIDPGGAGIDFLGGAAGGRFWGVIITEALHLYPILYLNIAAAMANLDPALDEAAAGLGAGRWRRFFRVTLPLILPGIFAGSTIVFIWSFTELGTPLMFDYYTVTPVQIFWGLSEVTANPRPYALVVVTLVVAVGLYGLSRCMLGSRSYAMQSKASIASTSRPLSGLAAIGAVGAFLVLGFIAVLPHIGVVLSSFSADGAWYRSVLPMEWTTTHYSNALSHPLAMASIHNSLVYASIAMLLAVATGVAIAYMAVRAKVRCAWVLDSLAMLPLAVPGLVMAFGYVAMSLAWPFGEGGWFAGMFDILGRNPNPGPLLVIAYAVRRLPYVVRSVSAGLAQTPVELEEAALNMGASTLYTMRRIVVPLIMANIIAGAILAFSFAMLEVSDSLILAQQEQHFPITRAIYELFSRLGDGPYIASALGVWGMGLLGVTLVGASLMLGKRMGAIFRI